MNKAIVVASYPDSPWLSDCLVSLKGVNYPVVIAMNTPEDNAFDPQGIYEAVRLGLEEFVLLHDSMVVKDQSIFDILFGMPGHVAVSPGGLMLIGKYVTAQLPALPKKPSGKKEAVYFELSYKNQVPWSHTLDPAFTDGNVFEVKHGKNRMVLENQWFKKYKGVYTMELAEQEDREAGR